MKYIVTLFFCAITNICFGQKDSLSLCNRNVRFNKFLKRLPKEVCLPGEDYYIFGIFDETDVNGDNLNDFIYSWCHNPIKEGDRMYVTIMEQKYDSIFIPLKTFSNLYPHHFNAYHSDYVPKDTFLIELCDKYMGEYWLYELKIENDYIIIDRKLDAESHLIIYYKFDQSVRNWVFEKCEEEFIYHNVKDITTKFDTILGPTIDDFTYFIW